MGVYFLRPRAGMSTSGLPCTTIPRPQPRAAAGSSQPGATGHPKARGASGARWIQMADRLFARQCRCSDPCNATHQLSRIPRPQARGAAGSPPAGARRAAQGQEERAARWLQMADRIICLPIFLLRSMQRHASASRIPSPQASGAARSPPAGARRAAQGQEERAARWLQMADRSFACQFSCSNPCNATHQPSRIPRPQASGAARKPASRGPPGSEGQRGERRAGSKWLTGYLLANFPAPIHATPRISLHESRAPKRVALPGARQPGPAGQPKAGGASGALAPNG